MDPFAAIGLASAIITFIDFGSKIVKISKEIHGSTSGMSNVNADLESLTKSMRELAMELKPSKSPSDLSVSEKGLLEVCHECEDLSAELLKVLDRIKSKTPGTKRSSISAALRHFKKKKNVEELGLRLEKCKSMFQIQLERMIRADLGQKLDSIVNSGNVHESEIRSLRKNTEILRSGVAVTSLEPKALEQLRLLLAHSDESIEKAAQFLILKHLRDENMSLRFFHIPEAHSQTLSWIFDGLHKSFADHSLPRWYYSRHADPSKVNTDTFNAMMKARNDFISFLKDDPLHKEDSIFHISGKPGAGKSTLMKYLYKHQSTLGALREWAGGLLTTLLYSILREAPALSNIAFEQQWHSFRASHFVDISPEEVRRGLDAILKNKDTFNTHRFCIFIDGLDEFLEEPENVIQQIRDWATFGGSDIKLLVSSREWLVFQQRFQRCPGLTLQAINRRDISLRIKDGLENIEGLETRDDRNEILELGYDLVEKAEGVFLWAKLALSTVQESAMSDDSVADIQHKIDALPKELEEVFQHIFNSMRNHRYEIERRRAMLTLQLVLESSGQGKGLRLLRYSFLDAYDNDQHFVLKSQFQSWSKTEVEARLGKAAKQVQRRCFGLVEVTSSEKGPRLTFIHRAVFEFMERKHTSQHIHAFTPDFDTLDFTCQSFLATIKFIDPPPNYYATRGRHLGEQFSSFPMLEVYWIDPPELADLSNNYYASHKLSTSQDLLSIPLSPFQLELSIILGDCSFSRHHKHPIPESFIRSLVEICNTRLQSEYEVSYGTPGYTYDGDPRACGVAESVLLTICTSGLYWLVQPATLLSQQQSNLYTIGLELLLWHTLSGIKASVLIDAPGQCAFKTLDCLFMECCRGTTGLPHDDVWVPNYWPGLWRRLVWSGFWDACGFLGSIPLEPLLRIFLLYAWTILNILKLRVVPTSKVDPIYGRRQLTMGRIM
ncbi:hypothetical protein PG990_007049 [Apiospora arundinis]